MHNFMLKIQYTKEFEDNIIHSMETKDNLVFISFMLNFISIYQSDVLII